MQNFASPLLNLTLMTWRLMTRTSPKRGLIVFYISQLIDSAIKIKNSDLKILIFSRRMSKLEIGIKFLVHYIHSKEVKMCFWEIKIQKIQIAKEKISSNDRTSINHRKDFYPVSWVWKVSKNQSFWVQNHYAAGMF